MKATAVLAVIVHLRTCDQSVGLHALTAVYYRFLAKSSKQEVLIQEVAAELAGLGQPLQGTTAQMHTTKETMLKAPVPRRAS